MDLSKEAHPREKEYAEWCGKREKSMKECSEMTRSMATSESFTQMADTTLDKSKTISLMAEEKECSQMEQLKTVRSKKENSLNE